LSQIVLINQAVIHNPAARRKIIEADDNEIETAHKVN